MNPVTGHNGARALPWPRVLAFIGAALVALGLLIGSLPMSAYGVNCGSAFAQSDDPHVADIGDTLLGSTPRTGIFGGVAVACDDKRSDRQAITTVTLVAGGLVLLGALFTRSPRQQSPDR